MSIYFIVLLVAVIAAAASTALVPSASPAIATQVEAAASGRKYIRWSPLDPLIVIGLIAFSALRFRVGTDYEMYWRFYQIADPAGNWSDQIVFFKQDAGYTILALLTKSISADPFAIFWVTSALTVIPIYIVLRRESQDLAFSVLLYICLAFYVAPFNGVRQGIAVALCFWAYSFAGRRWLTFALLGGLAVAFHASAVIAIGGYLLIRKWKPTFVTAAIVLIASAALSAVMWSVPAVTNLLGALNARYEGYATRGLESGTGTYLTILFFLGLALCCLALRKHTDRSDWLAMVIASVLPLVVATQVVEAARLSAYFAIFNILLIPNIMQDMKKPGFLKFAIVAVSVVYFYMYLGNFGDLIPYQTY